MKADLRQRRFRFAYRYLGPVFNEFCHRLYVYQQAFADRGACALYMARGGMRLRSLFELFLRSGVYQRYAHEYLDPAQLDAVDVDAVLAKTPV